MWSCAWPGGTILPCPADVDSPPPPRPWRRPRSSAEAPARRLGLTSIATDNLELILFGWLEAMRRRDPQRIASRLAEGVIWQGLRPELVCRNRNDVMGNIATGGEQRDRVRGVTVDALDDEHVLLGVRIPGLEDLFGTPVAGEVYELFTIRDGVIMRVDEFADREKALARISGRAP